MLSKEDKIRFIQDMLVDHPCLDSLFFDENKMLHIDIRKQLMNLSNFLIERASSYFTNFNVQDIFLIGSICEYMYTDKSDIDIFIIVDDLVNEFDDNNDKIMNILTCDAQIKNMTFTVHKHPVDISFVKRYKLFNYATYSILNNKWNIEPERLKFEYGAEELFYEYCKFSADLNRFVASLNKINGAFLDLESCHKLRDRIKEIKDNAYMAKDENPLHGYCKEYNIYRVAKRFGLLKHFTKYVNDSYKYITGTEHARR